MASHQSMVVRRPSSTAKLKVVPLSCCYALSYTCSGQAYVGAFLRKSDKLLQEEAAAAAAADSDAAGAPDPAAHLYEVGTFAQVRGWEAVQQGWKGAAGWRCRRYPPQRRCPTAVPAALLF